MRASVEPDLAEIAPSDGDIFLLCSDGLTNHVEDHEIPKVLAEEEEPEKVARALVDLANQRGGEDNVTAVVARFEA